jgi:hypothetical protein
LKVAHTGAQLARSVRVAVVTELDVAFAGIIAGAVVGGTAPWVTWIVAKSTRAHERRLAADARLYASRSDVYQRYMAYLYGVMLTIERTEPILQIGPEPAPIPVGPTDEEASELGAHLATFGAPAVLDAAEEFIRLSRDFFGRATAARLIRDQHGGGRPVPMVGEAYEALHAARENAREQLRRVEAAVRVDLAEPQAPRK